MTSVSRIVIYDEYHASAIFGIPGPLELTDPRPRPND